MSEIAIPVESWPAGENPAALPDREVHVWSASLAIDEELRRRLSDWLSDEERARAGRFYFDRDRGRFIACRGRLRALLGAYLQKAPHEIQFHYGPHGKPGLASHAGTPLFFNVSHSHDLALFAFRRRGEIGVDVERLRPVGEAESIARRYFTPREWETLRELPTDARTAAFFRCWTRKEALLKAIGVGLSFSLNEVEVSLREDEPARLLAVPARGRPQAAEWRLDHLAPAADYVGALASGDHGETLVFRRWVDA
jgi:4'-phosphopantetheinyl transferase